MILSAADIVRLIGADAIIREEARIQIVDGQPGLGTGDTVYIYIDKYPTIKDFEATWEIWVQDNSGMGEFVLKALTALLPKFDFVDGHYQTTDFASERTVIKTEAEKQLEQLAAEGIERQESFIGLQKGLEARLSKIKDGRDGRDGADGLPGLPGRDGKDGRDGRDLDATETSLFDLEDVEYSMLALEKGQVLMYDGTKWTNLYVPQVYSIRGGGGGGGGGTGDGELVIISDDTPTTRDDGSPLQDGDQWWSSLYGRMHIYYIDQDGAQWVQSSADKQGGGGSGGGIPEAPIDGNYYVRWNAQWIDLRTALDNINDDDTEFDAGDFENGTSDAQDDRIIDGGNIDTGVATGSGITVNGGDFSA